MNEQNIPFSDLQEISTFLEDGESIRRLLYLQERQEDSQFHMPVIGQFSSGKSKLLNQIFQEDILPTRQTETTAFTTMIEYGEEEAVFIEYKNGEREQIDPFSLREINQAQLDTYELSEIVDIEGLQADQVESIHVFYPHPILASGLVFIDTPGLNTVIEEHEAQTHSILSQADLVMYVLGKGITAEDEQLISSLNEAGIPILFVRTHLDELKAEEGDTPEYIMEADRKELQKIMNEPVDYFGVTNLSELMQYKKWNQLSTRFLMHLEGEVARQLETKRKQSIERQVQPIQQSLRHQLEMHANHIQTVDQHSLEELIQKKESIQKEMHFIQEKTEHQQSVVFSAFQQLERELKEHYDEVMKRSIYEFESILQDENDLNKLGILARKKNFEKQKEVLQELIEWTKNQLTFYVDQLVQRFNLSLTASDVPVLSVEGVKTIELRVQAPTVEEIVQTGELIEQRSQLEDQYYQEQLKSLENKRNELLLEESKSNERVQQLERKIEELQTREISYIEQSDQTVSENFKKIGKLADLALILVPPAKFVQGAQVASKVVKTGKVAQFLQQGGKTLSNAAKMKQKSIGITHSKDNKTNKSLPEETLAPSTNFFDLLTVEHWLGEVGKTFDGPPTYIENPDEKRQLLQEEQDMKRKLQEEQRKEMRFLQQKYALESDQERIERGIELRRQFVERERLAKEQREQNRLEQRKRQVVGPYRENLVNAYHETINSINQKLQDNIKQNLQPLSELLPITMAKPLQKNLYEQQVLLEKLEEQVQQTEEKRTLYDEQLNRYFKVLQS